MSSNTRTPTPHPIKWGVLMTESNLPPPTPLAVLVFDIETAPMLTHLWHPKQKWVGAEQAISEPFMLTWAAKWYGKDRVMSKRLTGAEAKEQDDKRIVLELAKLIRQADQIIAHNGDRFDIPRVNARVAEHGAEPLGPVQSIDTLKMVRQSFAWPYNDLNSLGRRLVGETKRPHGGFEMWRSAFQGDDRALREMEKYNRQDVVLLEKVFDAIRPYVRSLPALYEAAYLGQDACPHCGSKHMIRRGVRRTKASIYARFQCRECQRYTQARSAQEIPKLKTRPV